MINIEPFIGISYYKDHKDHIEKYYDDPYNILIKSDLEDDEVLLDDHNNPLIFEQFLDRICNDNLEKVFGFLNYHYQKYIKKKGDGSLFFIFIQETLKENQFSSRDFFGTRKETILEWIETKKKELSQETAKDGGTEAPTLKKIEWKGSPALFGYLFTELVKNGFIEPPLHNGETNYTGLAKICYIYFNVNNTTLDNLIKEFNPNKNTLSDTKRAKFTIPNLSDLA